MTSLARVLLVLLPLGVSVSASATSIRYTLNLMGNGFFNGSSFGSSPILIEATGDPANVITDTLGILRLRNLITTVNVNGVTATFTRPFEVIANPNSWGLVGGFGDYTNAYASQFGASVSNASFATYDLRSAVGPLSGTANSDWRGVTDTSLGRFYIDSSTVGSFKARVVPEPASMAALALGATALVRRSRRVSRPKG